MYTRNTPNVLHVMNFFFSRKKNLWLIKRTYEMTKRNNKNQIANENLFICVILRQNNLVFECAHTQFYMHIRQFLHNKCMFPLCHCQCIWFIMHFNSNVLIWTKWRNKEKKSSKIIQQQRNKGILKLVFSMHFVLSLSHHFTLPELEWVLVWSFVLVVHMCARFESRNA